MTDILKRNNVAISGEGDKTIIYAHGFGCNQEMWSAIWPAFEQGYKQVLFDYVGSGQSDLLACPKSKRQLDKRTLDPIPSHRHYSSLTNASNAVRVPIIPFLANDFVRTGASRRNTDEWHTKIQTKDQIVHPTNWNWHIVVESLQSVG